MTNNYSEKAIEFLEMLEKTSMTKSYKIPVFLSLFEEGVKESVTLEEMGKVFYKYYHKEPHGKDLRDRNKEGWEQWNSEEFESLILKNPIKYLTSNRTSGKFLKYANGVLLLDKELCEEISKNKELLKDILQTINTRSFEYFTKKF